MDPHHIHIEHLHDDPTHSPCGSYSSSETLEDELDLDRLNRLSSTSTSTLVGANGNTSTNSRSSSPFDQEVKVNPSTRSSSASQPRGLWYRFTHSEAGRVVSAFCYFTFVCISMAFCNQLSDHRWVETGYTQVLLRDRGFDVIAPQSDIGPANFFVMTSVVLTVLGIGFICPTWTMRAVVLRRCLWVIGSLSVYRALTISVTTLPSPKEECRPSLKYGFWDMLIIAIQMIPGTVEACTDDIFSGHTVFMVSCAIQWRLYCKNKWVTYFSYLYISIGLYFVVATRLHYTVDVVLAIFITYGFWSVYIAMIDVVMEREYFGVQSHNEKYSAFDSASTEYEFSAYEDDLSTRHQSDFQIRRRRLAHQMNRIRGPGIGYGRGEYDRVAFVPMQLNVWLINIVRWCDGLDLRMRQDMPAASKNTTRWEELVVRYRSGRSTLTSTSNSPCSSANCCYRKSEADTYDRQNENGSEMVQLYHPNDVNSPLTGDSDDCNCVEDSDYNNNNQEQHFGRWRSLPLRSGSSRQRTSNYKEDKMSSKDRDMKLHILKVAVIVFVNTILLVKIVEAFQNWSTTPPPAPHSAQDINLNSNSALQSNSPIDPASAAGYHAPPEARNFEKRHDVTTATGSMYEVIANAGNDAGLIFGEAADDNDNGHAFNPNTLRRRLNLPIEEPEGAI